MILFWHLLPLLILQIADEELAEFELLEKEALDTSMSSNSSSVMSLVAANKSSNVNLNTSSPIQKAFTVDRGRKSFYFLSYFSRFLSFYLLEKGRYVKTIKGSTGNCDKNLYR